MERVLFFGVFLSFLVFGLLTYFGTYVDEYIKSHDFEQVLGDESAREVELVIEFSDSTSNYNFEIEQEVGLAQILWRVMDVGGVHVTYASGGGRLLGINGVMNRTDNYWNYYVNGERVDRSIGEIVLVPGDSVYLKYE